VPGVVYHGDGDEHPYATDANKFAFFCAAVASWVITRPQDPAVLHLHDWHSGVLAVLRRFDARYMRLARIPTVFTIHNLAYQGQRPLRDDASSLHAWFPTLRYTTAGVSDPAFPHVFNPMAAAIRLCDRINTVSPSYAREICRPSDPSAGFIGGEGLEEDLKQRERDGTLIGILNGGNYPQLPGRDRGRPPVARAAQAPGRSAGRLAAAGPGPGHCPDARAGQEPAQASR